MTDQNIEPQTLNNCLTCEKIRNGFGGADLMFSDNNSDEDNEHPSSSEPIYTSNEESADYSNSEFDDDFAELDSDIDQREIMLKSSCQNIKYVQQHKTFSTEKIRDIDRTNAILMQKILSFSHRPSQYSVSQKSFIVNPPSAAINRRKHQEKISRENQASGGASDIKSVREPLQKSYSQDRITVSSPGDPGFDTCSYDDFACLSMAASDKLGLEAIKTLHKQLDDDEDGNIDYEESDDFLKEELKYDHGAEKRQKTLHRDNDMHISVKELWEAWLRSEVHNWTIEQTVEWLEKSVELPQYSPNFILHKVAGANLPRLAVNNANYLAILGIKDPIHKQKIALKAMDVVLFGPPKDGPHWKDITLILLILSCGLGSWYGYRQNKKFKLHLNRMNKDMDGLQKAESELKNLQKELDLAQQAKESVLSEKQSLEKKLQDSQGDFGTMTGSYSDLEVAQIKAENELLKSQLQAAEGELRDKCWAPPIQLQNWLQLTYEIENRVFLKKKRDAETQLQQAREACEKLRKKRSNLIGAFVSTHGKSIDEVDRSIVEARTSLNEVTQELQEKVHRWKQIEMLCGFGIMTNIGLSSLENMLYRNQLNGRSLGMRGRMNSTDDLDDETGTLYFGGTVESGMTRDGGDSSGSENSKMEEERSECSLSASRGNVQFTVGSEVYEEPTIRTLPKLSSNPRSVSQMNIHVNPTKIPTSQMIRSVSQDVGQIVSTDMHKQPKAATSESSLDIKKTLHPLEEDLCSTDSSLMEENDVKKKKRKIFNFSSKKGKNKGD